MSVPRTGDEALCKQAEHELFLVRFANWRLSMVGAVGVGLIVGGMFFHVSRAPALLWWMALHTAAYLCIAASCRLYERRWPAPQSREQRRWHLAWTAAAGIATAVTGSLPWCLPADRPELVLSSAVIVCIVIIAFVASRGYRPVVYATLAGQTVALSVALALHARMPWAVPIAWLFAGFVLVFALKLNRSLLTAIEQRLQVQRLSAELEMTHRRQLQVEQLQAALGERKRMMEDIHDGLGSSLLSSLVLLESGKQSVPEAAAVMRECVDDLRLIVDSQEAASQDLSTLVAMLRYRLQRRIGSAGIQLRWRMPAELPSRASLSPSQSLDLMRILQEAIANALNHARASEIEFIAQPATDGAVEFVVADNGCGFDPRGVALHGRGIRGMRSRADRLGATLDIRSAAGGTRVALRLPACAVP